MKEQRILKDIDDLCRDLVDCIKTSRQCIDAQRLNSYEVAEKMTGIVVEMGSLLLELQQSRLVDGAVGKGRSDAIAELIEYCKELEGKLKEQRNDLKK